MIEDEKIAALKELQKEMGSPMAESVTAKSWKEEFLESISGTLLFLGLGAHTYCSYQYSSGLGVYWVIIAILILWSTLFTSNRLVRLTKLIDGDKGLASSVIFVLYEFLLQVCVLVAFFALLFDWKLSLLLILPWLSYAVVEQYQGRRKLRSWVPFF